MSSHESFEFLAIDRLLTPEECEELRAVSTRAVISVASFRNEYQWGRLRADPHRLLEKYFDAFLHFGSWGVRELALRFPSSRLRWQDLRPYFVEEAGGLERSRGKLIVFWRREDEGARWEGDQLPPLALLAGVRAELLAGDLRAAYLAWLIAVHCGELPDEIEEPPVPPGLSKLSRPQRALADFFVLDADLLRVAAAGAKPAVASRARSAVRRRCAGDLRLLVERKERAREQRRGSAELVSSDDIARLSATMLGPLARDGEQPWLELEGLLVARRYPEAVRHLRELRRTYAGLPLRESFELRLADLRTRHARKRTFWAQWDAASARKKR